MNDEHDAPQQEWAIDFLADSLWRHTRNHNTRLDAKMTDAPQEIKDGDIVTAYRPGKPFMLTVSQSSPEYVFEEVSRERLSDGSLRIKIVRRERRPDDAPNAVLSMPDNESEDRP